jgi:ABC-type arginine transport system permease subunit
MIEKVLSIKRRMSQFKIWFIDWLEFLIDIILTHARIWKFKLKLCVKTLFSFTLTLMQLFIVLFVSFIFCSKSMFETQVKKLLLLIYAFFYYILKCIHDMIVMCINYFQSQNYCTHNRVESINL